MRLTPLSSTQSADKLQKRKNPTSHQHPAQQGRKGEVDGRAEKQSWKFGGTVEFGGRVGAGALETVGTFSRVPTGR